MTDRLQTAMFSPCFPCNPVPFAQGLADYVREHGSDSIQSDKAKRILWILMAQAYGQLARIDLMTEYSRLELPESKPCIDCGGSRIDEGICLDCYDKDHAAA